jgi:hypothetical protein
MGLKKFFLVFVMVILFIFSGCSGGVVSSASFDFLFPMINNIFGVPVDGQFSLTVKGVKTLDVELGDQEDNLEKIAQDAIEMTTEQATVNLTSLELENGKKYYYRVTVSDKSGKQKQSNIQAFETVFAEEDKDIVLEDVLKTFPDGEFISESEFSSLTNTGTITVIEKIGKTVRDIWALFNDFLVNHEEKAFPIVIENTMEGLDGTYYYANSRLYPELNYDISAKDFIDEYDGKEPDPYSLLYNCIDSGAIYTKLENAESKVSFSFTIQGELYTFIFLFEV